MTNSDLYDFQRIRYKR